MDMGETLEPELKIGDARDFGLVLHTRHVEDIEIVRARASCDESGVGSDMATAILERHSETLLVHFRDRQQREPQIRHMIDV